MYYWIPNRRNDSAGLLIGSWATKATPVLCIHFTRKNLMIASGPAALQEDKSPHKTWTTPPLQKSPSGQCWRVGCQQMLSSLSYGTMADFQYTWIGGLHFQYSYECLHVQFTWWLLMTTDKFVQDGSGLSRRLSCSFDPSACRPVWERAGCLPQLDLARFWHYTLYSMKQTVVIAGGIAVHTFFLCLCIVHCVPVCIKWKEIDDWMKYA